MRDHSESESLSSAEKRGVNASTGRGDCQDAATEADSNLLRQLEATIDATWPTAEVPQDSVERTMRVESDEQQIGSQTLLVNERKVSHAEVTAPSDVEYQLLQLIGRGGMGVVFQARQAALKRAVAVKMIRSDTPVTEVEERKFLDEAAVTGKLDHPNIVPVYDLGRTANGQLFYAMKEVRGRCWKDDIRSNSDAENVRILTRVADAVAFAHSRDVIHRDIKPENVMLGEFGEVLLMDWGLAMTPSADTRQAVGGTPCYMAPEMVANSPAAVGIHSDVYLLGAVLFEIVTGRPPHIGRDVRKCLLSAALNRIVTVNASGELYDIALKAMATDPADRHATVLEFQEALQTYQSHSESKSLAGRAQECLEQACQGGSYEEYSQALFGFQNAIDLWESNGTALVGLAETRLAYARQALAKEDFDLGLSLLPANDSDPECVALRQELSMAQLERTTRDRRLRGVKRLAAGLALGLALVMTVAVIWIAQAEKTARQERDTAREQYRRAETNLTIARSAVDQMVTRFAEEDLENVPQMEGARQVLLEKALSFYLQFLEDQPTDSVVRASTAAAYHRVGVICSQLGRHEQAERAYLESIQLYRQLLAEFPQNADYTQLVAVSQNDLGELYRQLGRADEAESQYRKAFQGQASLVQKRLGLPRSRQELARTSYNLGLVCWATSRAEQAQQAYDHAIHHLKILLEEDATSARYRQGLARAHLNRGLLFRSTQDVAAARADYDRAIVLLEGLHDEKPDQAEYSVELAAAYNNLGNLLLVDPDQSEEAGRVYLAGVELLADLVKDFPQVTHYRRELANSLNSLAAHFYFRQDLAAAEQRWREAHDVAQSLRDEHPEVPDYQALLARTLGNLGALQNDQQRFAQGRDLLEKAVQIQWAVIEKSSDHPEYLIGQRNYLWGLTKSLVGTKDHQTAASTAEELVTLFPEDPQEIYLASALIATCLTAVAEDELVEQTRYAERACQLLEQAIELGYDDRETLDKDDRFQPLREDERFLRIRARLQ